jgi:peptidoglycan/xylan/chitin deacetylase (PgdA/CDA1 family)
MIVRAGNEIGHHSYSHGCAGDSLDQKNLEVEKGLDALKRTVGMVLIARHPLTLAPAGHRPSLPNGAAARNDRFHPDILRSLVRKRHPAGRGLLLSWQRSPTLLLEGGKDLYISLPGGETVETRGS